MNFLFIPVTSMNFAYWQKTGMVAWPAFRRFGHMRGKLMIAT
jgi:hypothetical protein